MPKLNYLIVLLIGFLFLINETYQVFNIDDFGAIPNDPSFDAAIKNGKAFNSALIAANKSSSDRIVLIEGGKVYGFLPAAADVPHLVNLTIQLDAKLNSWDEDHSKYPRDNSGNVFNFICLSNSENLTIKGNGVIQGNGYRWWLYVIQTGLDNRPNLIELKKSKNLLIDGITLLNAPVLNFNINAALNAVIINVVIRVSIAYNSTTAVTFPLNTDGIDISGKNVYMRNLTIENFDDAVAVKPTSRGGPWSDCTENILVEQSYVKYGVGMSIGSVPPNPGVNCVRNVTFRNIRFENPLKAIYIKPNPAEDGTGLISDILYENIEIHNAIWWAIFIGTQQQHQPHGSGTGCDFFFPLPGFKCITDPLVTVTNITLRNVNIHGGILSPGLILCNQTNPCTNFLFDNVNVYDRSSFPVAEGYMCENVMGHAINSNLVPDCFKNSSIKKN